MVVMPLPDWSLGWENQFYGIGVFLVFCGGRIRRRRRGRKVVGVSYGRGQLCLGCCAVWTLLVGILYTGRQDDT